MGESMARISQTTKRWRTTRALEGVKTVFPGDGSLQIAGRAYTYAKLRELLQAQLDALDAIEAARSAYAYAVARERELAPRVNRVLVSLQLSLRGKHGADVALLGQFGFRPPRKPGPKTVASRRRVVEKGRATRAAKGHAARKES